MKRQLTIFTAFIIAAVVLSLWYSIFGLIVQIIGMIYLFLKMRSWKIVNGGITDMIGTTAISFNIVTIILIDFVQLESLSLPSVILTLLAFGVYIFVNERLIRNSYERKVDNHEDVS